MAIYTQADVCRGLGKPPQHFQDIKDMAPADFLGVPRKDGTRARHYWDEDTLVQWAAATGRKFDTFRARRG